MMRYFNINIILRKKIIDEDMGQLMKQAQEMQEKMGSFQRA